VFAITLVGLVGLLISSWASAGEVVSVGHDAGDACDDSGQQLVHVEHTLTKMVVAFEMGPLVAVTATV